MPLMIPAVAQREQWLPFPYLEHSDMNTDTKPSPDELQADLDRFIGGGDVFRHWTRRLLYTEGIQYLAENAAAYWLIDAVASYQGERVIRRSERLQAFQLWS